MTTQTESPAMEPQQTSGPIPVLVLGDWIVDENWVLSRHQSRYSSVEGHAHLRALGGLESTSRELCGAGRVAKFLYWHKRFAPDGGSVRWLERGKREGVWFDIVGVGTWGRQDTPTLQRMFHPEYLAGINAFTLNPQPRKKLPEHELDGLRLWNLAKACAAKEGAAKEDADVGTTRLFRLYQNRAEVEGGLDLAQRIDFELRSESRSYDAKALPDLLKTFRDTPPAADSTPPLVPPFGFAIIVDFGDGTIAESVMDGLNEAKLIDEKTLWLVTTKHPRPGWLENWKRNWGRILCWFLHPRAVAQLEFGGQSTHAAGNHLPELPTEWFIAGQGENVDGSRPAREAILGLQELFQSQVKHFKDGGILVAMPKGLSLLAVREMGEERCGFYQAKPLLSETNEELIGRATIFFCALAAELIQHEEVEEENVPKGAKDRLEDFLCQAVEVARRFVEAGIEQLARVGEEKEGKEEKKKKEPGIGVPAGLGIYPVRTDDSTFRVHRFNWHDVIADWKAALTGTGVLRRDSKYQLDVWRAMCELQGYIELVDDRRREIARLIHRLRQFDPRKAPGSISALLIASPGSGKSYLVSLLAKKLGMERLSFNVTQMVTRENLVACFDAIASSQAHDRDRPHLVFFDEINALVESSHVYDLFLTVLEDGTYLRGGQRFKLDPCVWLFAGTERLRTGAQAREEMAGSGTLEQYLASKAPDFRSRLTLKGVELDRRGTDEEVRLGFVYQGAVQLQRLHPDVRRISAEVLSAFYCLPLDTSIRDLIHVAERFQDIQFGEVRRRNMPEDLPRGTPGIWQEEFEADGKGHAPLHGEHDLDHDMVEIRLHPGRNGGC